MPNDLIPLEGSELNPLPGSRAIGRPNPARVITVTVVLRPRRAARELHSRVAELSRHPLGEREHSLDGILRPNIALIPPRLTSSGDLQDEMA